MSLVMSANRAARTGPGNPFVQRWAATSQNDSPEAALVKDMAFQKAQKISKEIDENISESKKVLDKKKKSAQILLLGQSESGKSAILRNFQLTFAPSQFHAERPIWKAVIQLNVIRNIKRILEVLTEEWQTTTVVAPNTRDLQRIRLGLSPLLFIETNLTKMISPGEVASQHRDICVRPNGEWKSLIRSRRAGSPPSGVSPDRNYRLQNGTDPTSALAALKDDIITLWEDPGVQAVLKKRHVRLEETPGFFMNDIARVADINYEPTDCDMMRARVRTLGVEEHHFVIEKGLDVGTDVYVTDVGGARSHRARWVPYFEDVQTIMFLAPLAFNQQLEEDPKINRLEDSIMLWKDICSNKILANAIIILFFNKKDVLSATLAAGVRVNKYVPTYPDGNNVDAVTKYFKHRFRSYHRRLSPSERPFIFHQTTAIDTTEMAALLIGVRDTILRINLKSGEMI